MSPQGLKKARAASTAFSMHVVRLLGLMLALSLPASFLDSATALGAQVEARKDGVKVYSKATSKSAVKHQLKKGETLDSLERKGMYWTVTLPDGSKGFVSVLKVKRRADGDSSLSKAIRSVVKQGRVDDDTGSVRSRSAVMGVRGAVEDPNAAFAGNVRPNLRAVYYMEDIHVPQKRLERLGELVFSEIERKAAARERP